MFDEKTNNNNLEKLNRNEEKILYSVDKIVCFACGEKIDKETTVCPYCKTTIK
ncbi:MAG: hypothetical protein HWN81_00910 [Candidatus Lokiarchaeota archaeon]|nr:hypothetical protein [Candidatus Lokiarchaeota archaeon]